MPNRRSGVSEVDPRPPMRAPYLAGLLLIPILVGTFLAALHTAIVGEGNLTQGFAMTYVVAGMIGVPVLGVLLRARATPPWSDFLLLVVLATVLFLYVSEWFSLAGLLGAALWVAVAARSPSARVPQRRRSAARFGTAQLAGDLGTPSADRGRSPRQTRSGKTAEQPSTTKRTAGPKQGDAATAPTPRTPTDGPPDEALQEPWDARLPIPKPEQRPTGLGQASIELLPQQGRTKLLVAAILLGVFCGVGLWLALQGVASGDVAAVIVGGIVAAFTGLLIFAVIRAALAGEQLLLIDEHTISRAGIISWNLAWEDVGAVGLRITKRSRKRGELVELMFALRDRSVGDTIFTRGRVGDDVAPFTHSEPFPPMGAEVPAATAAALAERVPDLFVGVVES